MIQEAPRKPALALLGSLVAPGLGQIYNGQVIKGLLIFLILLVLMPHSPLVSWVALHSTKHLILIILLLFTALALGIYIYNLRDAYRTASQTGASYQLKSANRAYIYAFMLIVSSGLYAASCIYTNRHLIQSVYVPTASMLPNVMPGDYVFVDKRVHCINCKTPLVHGDLAIFHQAQDDKKLYVKRIIAMPGDKLVMKGKAIFVNDVPIRTIEVTQFSHTELDNLMNTHSAWREKDDKAVYTVIWEKHDPGKDASYTVPAGQIFVLGDNRSASDDSGKFGMIPISHVVGIAKQAWFSYSPQSGIRWWRIGHPVDALY